MVRAEPTVVVVGAGGLGCPIALSLAEANVALRLVDDDVVELSNLQRQVLYRTRDVGQPKVEVARARLRELFPNATIEARRGRVDALTADALLAGAALVIDGTDDPSARFVINDWAIAQRIPAVLGGIHRFRGLVMGIAPGSSCFRCLFEEDHAGLAPSCAQIGVLGALAGLVGHLQAERALALLHHRRPLSRGPQRAVGLGASIEPLGRSVLAPVEEAAHALAGENVTGFVTTIDTLGGRTRSVSVPRADDCPACSGKSTRRSNVLTLAAL